MGTGTSYKGSIVKSTPDKRIVVDEPQWASMSALRLRRIDTEKIAYQSNIVVLRPIIPNHKMEFSWEQSFTMLESARIEKPEYLGDYIGALKKLGHYLERWGRENLTIGLEAHVYGHRFDPKMQIFFQKKSDMVKFKLTWCGL